MTSLALILSPQIGEQLGDLDDSSWWRMRGHSIRFDRRIINEFVITLIPRQSRAGELIIFVSRDFKRIRKQGRLVPAAENVGDMGPTTRSLNLNILDLQNTYLFTQNINPLAQRDVIKWGIL